MDLSSKKPITKIDEAVVDASEDLAEAKNEAFIYPEKKPVIFKKVVNKAVQKSTILSKKDYKIAKAVFESIDKKNGKLH